MRITIAAPIRPGSTSGNRVTAERWARRLGELGHDVHVAAMAPDAHTAGNDVAAGSDLLIALHARRCAAAVSASREHRPQRPVVVGLAGTDLYGDLPDDARTRASVEAADRLVVLQARGIDRLEAAVAGSADRTHVVHQSVEPPVLAHRPGADAFVVAVLAHLRSVKDPLLAARAARHLPESSTVVVEHAGVAHDDAWTTMARTELAENSRYRWHGELARPDAMALLARSHVLACTSTLEGGANVVTEAIAHGVPVVGTDVDGTAGLLGDAYPGLVPVGDDRALAELLGRLERDPGAYGSLVAAVLERRWITEPATERASWAEVLAAL